MRSRRRSSGLCYLSLALMAMAGCESTRTDQPRVEQAIEYLPEESWPVQEVMASIHQVRPWPGPAPEPEYSAKDWANLLRAASILQRIDPGMAAQAMDDYVIHFGTAFEEGVDYIAEWSKILLLLRVMFVLPQDEASSRKYGVMAFGGFAWTSSSMDREARLTVALPIEWTDDGPVMVARSMRYNGAPYKALEEYEYFLAHFPFRKNLEGYLRRLDAASTRESETRGAVPDSSPTADKSLEQQ